MNVLVIEDDATLSKNISAALEAEGMNVEVAFDGKLAERMMLKQKFDCVVMDINLPGKNGFDLCRDFRKVDSVTPVIMLTAFGELEDKVEGFDCGADDYLTKPFYMRELMVRVNTLVRRSKKFGSREPDNGVIAAGDISIHDAQKRVYRKGEEIRLTPREYQILRKLAEKPGEIISKNELIAEIWGRSFDTNTNTIEVYINFLRNKIDKPFGTSCLKTRVGYGYFLDFS